MSDGASHDLSTSVRSLVSEGAAVVYSELLAGRPIGDDSQDAVDELVHAGLVGLGHSSGEPFAYPPRLALTRAAHNVTRAWLEAAPDIERLVEALDTLGPESLPAADNRQIATMLDLHERTIRRRVNELQDHFGEIERAALVRHAHVAPGT